MEEHKNTSYASPKSGEEVERELEAYINEPKNGKRRRISLSGAQPGAARCPRFRPWPLRRAT